jgi:hypothetical protein
LEVCSAEAGMTAGNNPAITTKNESANEMIAQKIFLQTLIA